MEPIEVLRSLYSLGPENWEDLFQLTDAPPELLLSSQISRYARPESGEYKLLAAVLNDACDDLLGRRARWHTKGTDRIENWHAQAQQWFAEPDTGQISLRMVCAAFGWEIGKWQRWAALAASVSGPQASRSSQSTAR